jgi:hypothetical protein
MAEMAAAGLLLLGTLVSIVLLIRRGQPPIGALSLVAVVGSGVVVGLSARRTPSSSLLGKWALIAAAAVAAVPLVVSVSER